MGDPFHFAIGSRESAGGQLPLLRFQHFLA
ncbi:hypothetical protein ACVWZR_002249 [Bradyrhizobium sp. i1.3.1]